MTANQLIQILDRNKQHYMLHRWFGTGNIRKVAYIEDNANEHRKAVRFWYFCEITGELTATGSDPAPNGEMDLLADYADDLEFYGNVGCVTVEWH